MLCVALLACLACAMPAAANHVACGDTITQDTTLDSDLVDCANGLTIAADNVTLDLGGHKIDGTGEIGNGVEARTIAGTEIRNGTIRQFRYGVLGEEPNGMRFTELHLEDNLVGADLFISRGATEIVDTEVTGGSYGLNLDGTIHVARTRVSGASEIGIPLDYTHGTIEDSTIEGNGIGIELEEAEALITHNHIVNNVKSGIEYGYWQHGDVVENVIEGNDIGIYDRGTSFLTVTGNLLRGNKRYGAFLNALAPVTGNRASWNGINGLLIDDDGPSDGASSPLCVVNGNTALRNAKEGIVVRGRSDDPGCESTRVINNDVHHNGADGLLLDAPGLDTMVVANRAVANGDDGIDVQGTFGDDLQPAWSPDGTMLAFRSERAGAAGLYVTGLDGEELLRLSDGREPDWSPDGNRIAYTAGGQIRLIAPDGTQQEIVGAGSKPRWSPDGAEILFEAGGELRTFKLATGTVRTLAQGTDGEWSPDSTKIAFFNAGIRVIDRDGTNDTKIASGTSPSWSPDGSRIAFSDGWDIGTIAPDGSDQQYVTVDEPIDAGPLWSPRGDLIAVYRGDDPAGAGTYLVQPDGGNLRFLTSMRDGVWSPDGTRIAFSGLAVVDIATGEVTATGNNFNPFVTLSRNRANSNQDLGIEGGLGVKDGTGNRAADNGDARQCVRVACSP
jgi:Tol biopolymer transport system component